MKKKAKMTTAQRAEAIMTELAKEMPEVRLEIAKSFPAYNSLLNLHAKSFKEFALLPIAREQGVNVSDPLFDYRSVVPYCPQCNNQKCVIRKGKSGYLCNNCGIKFQANYNSLSSGFKLSSVVWRKVLDCMLNFYTIETSCDYCDITATTFYNIRNRIFYAMQLLMEKVKLYGNIQCDNTFVHLSYKGTRLIQEEYPEDSPFAEITTAPRKARSRGGTYSYAEKNKNQICIFTAIDEYGHVLARMVGVGSATGKKLYNSVGSMKYLYSIPSSDPFKLSLKTRNVVHDNEGVASMLISDREGAIAQYASKIHLKFESNVYRINGKQVRLKEGAHDIQRVNSLHSRLKNYLRRLNYVSSKYLPGFLTMFEFIENTGASEEAIGQLFEILAHPGLDRDKSFFDNLFIIPIAEEKAEVKSAKKKAETPKQRLNSSTALALYLYHQFLYEPQVSVSLPYIAEITNFNVESIQKIYAEAEVSGALEVMLQTINSSETKKPLWVQKTIPADFLTYYDDYLELNKTSKSGRLSLKNFVIEENEKYNKSLSYGMVKYYFEKIIQYGFKEPIPKKENHGKGRPVVFKQTQEKYIAIYKECLECYNAHRANNDGVSWREACGEIGAKYGKTLINMTNMANLGKRLLEK